MTKVINRGFNSIYTPVKQGVMNDCLRVCKHKEELKKLKYKWDSVTFYP